MVGHHLREHSAPSAAASTSAASNLPAALATTQLLVMRAAATVAHLHKESLKKEGGKSLCKFITAHLIGQFSAQNGFSRVSSSLGRFAFGRTLVQQTRLRFQEGKFTAKVLEWKWKIGNFNLSCSFSLLLLFNLRLSSYFFFSQIYPSKHSPK
jgi:hypothetical protein